MGFGSTSSSCLQFSVVLAYEAQWAPYQGAAIAESLFALLQNERWRISTVVTYIEAVLVSDLLSDEIFRSNSKMACAQVIHAGGLSLRYERLIVCQCHEWNEPGDKC